jgi:hypothetical protein
MTNQGFPIRVSGLAAALLVHAAFAGALIVGQPQPDLYLAQLAAVPRAEPAPPQVQLAQADTAPGELPAPRLFRP